MAYCLITFRSVTPAQRGEALLRQNGLQCSLHRTPRWMEEQGCGYSIRVAQPEVNRASQLLQAGELPYRKIYLRRENGGMEELRL